MDYDKIIIEMLSRIQKLEEEVEKLKGADSKEKKVTMTDIREFIEEMTKDAIRSGESSLEIRASEIHKAMGLKQRFPMVCNAMRQCMGNNDYIIHETASGNSSSFSVCYRLR